MSFADRIPSLNRSVQSKVWLARYWNVILNVLLGLYALTPFLAPIFMKLGFAIPGKVIYWVYSFLCHQLPERSYFLFGPKISYSLTEIQAVWPVDNFVILRRFVGNAQMGWKVAWSDRMVSMFTSLWLFGMVWGWVRKKIKPLRWWGFVLLLLPLAIDGITHTISDLSGIGQGFRDSNAWLAALTNHAFSSEFYAGDAWGSFNAWMRLISGVLFGLGMVTFGFPYLDEIFTFSEQAAIEINQYRNLRQKEKERLLKLTMPALREEDLQTKMTHASGEDSSTV
jgi:uncharacterized membrane protein